MPWGAAAAAAATIGGAVISSNAAKSAAQTSANAQLEASRQAAEAQRFRPVGISTRFGTSTFEMGPDGYLQSAGYTVSPEVRAIQDRLLTQAGAYRPEMIGEMAQPLGTAATGLFNLGGQYLATSPEAAAQQYMQQQRGLLQPGRERALSTIQSRLFGTGRGGLGVQTGTGTAPTSPELQAYYNALAQQEERLAAQADQYGRERTLFGTQLYGRGAELLGQLPTLTTQGYGPLQTQLGLGAEIERLGQTPLDIGAQLGGRSATAGANVGQTLLSGGLGAARTLQAANQYSVPGSLLTGFGSQLSGSTQQNQLGNWFNNLMYGAENVYGGAGRGTVPTSITADTWSWGE
jgi:hypothetical protein